MSEFIWQKSSFSGSNGNGECLELAAARESVLLRESDAPQTVLSVPRARLAGLLRFARMDGFARLR